MYTYFCLRHYNIIASLLLSVRIDSLLYVRVYLLLSVSVHYVTVPLPIAILNRFPDPVLFVKEKQSKESELEIGRVIIIHSARRVIESRE